MNKRIAYCFLYDSNRKYYRATQGPDGTYSVTKSGTPRPLASNPENLKNSPVEFGTNQKYLSLVRGIGESLEFVRDGAAILRHCYYNGAGISEDVFITVIVWNGDLGYYVLGYNAKIDFQKKSELPKSDKFTVSTIDDSAWGVLADNDTKVFAIDSSSDNPKSVPVLYDGINLQGRYTYNPARMNVAFRYNYAHSIPVVLINQDGDSAHIVSKSQEYAEIYNSDYNSYVSSTSNFIFDSYRNTTINISGQLQFITSNISNGNARVAILHRIETSLGNGIDIHAIYEPDQNGKTWTFDFDFDITLSVDEKIMITRLDAGLPESHLNVNYLTTNIIIKTVTRHDAVVRRGLRPYDVLKELVSKATYGRYGIKSSFFEDNNNSIILSGDNLRDEDNPEIYSSFYDFFQTFNAKEFMALKCVKGEVFMEKAIEVYKRDSVIIDLGEAIECELVPAEELFFSEIEVGSPKVDLRHQSGRLEFNTTNTFTVEKKGIERKLDLVTKYRLGCYEQQFLIQDYIGKNSKDNTGDKSVYIAEVTDQLGTAVSDIPNYETVTINNVTLAPIIKYPLNNEVINYDKPVIRGIGIPGNTVNIYVFGVLDGSTVIDGAGNWEYNIANPLDAYNPGIETGISDINATYTDMTAVHSTISIMVDLIFTQSTIISYPKTGDTLYNNKPLVYGKAPAGTNIDIYLDGVVVGSVVTDNSCGWRFKMPVIPNGNRVIMINMLSDTAVIDVDANPEVPLITYIGSELDGFPIVNPLPLIEGVAKPGTLVTLWLDYIKYNSLGSVIADSNGNWSLQTVPTTYNDPVNGPTVLSPIPNGLHTISTDLLVKTSGISVKGYKLNRPNYSSIEGVYDNSVFNTTWSPKRMLMNWFPYFAASESKQLNKFIHGETFDKNGNLVTIIGGVTISERADISGSELGSPFAMFEFAKIKVKALRTFAEALSDFSNGGLIKFKYRGKDIFALPIGSMKMKSIVDDVQEWKVLLSPDNNYSTLLNLYKNGITVNLMENAIYHSDYNTLHMVEYDYQKNPKYNTLDIYQDWFENRNEFWLLNPDYIQKVQTTDPLKDQIITNGVTGITLKLYRCKDAKMITSVNYQPPAIAPIPLPDIVLEASLDMSLYPEDQYFTVMYVGETPVYISERFETKANWEKTILIEAKSTKNKPAWFNSTGITTAIRVEGIVKKYNYSAQSSISRDENGSSDNLFSDISAMRDVRFGKASGIPDYLYRKIFLALYLDDLKIEGVSYTASGEEISKSEDVPGIPLYYYSITLYAKTFEKGNTIIGPGGSGSGKAILVVDPTAMGLPGGSLINIDES